jgi:hypothetical protein
MGLMTLSWLDIAGRAKRREMDSMTQRVKPVTESVVLAVKRALVKGIAPANPH